jgi:hypothetical protein
MAEMLEFDPYANGQFILAFDGRILEIFGKITSRIDMHPTTTDSWSIHVKQLNVKVTGPDKKGLREVRFLTPASPKLAPKTKWPQSSRARSTRSTGFLVTTPGVRTGATEGRLGEERGLK